MPAAAVVGAGLVGGLIAGERQRKSASQAADVSKASSAADTALQREMYYQSRQDTLDREQQSRQALDPYRQAGLNALSGYNQLSPGDPTAGAQMYLQELQGTDKYISQLEGLDIPQFKLDENDPVYQWRQKENQRQVNQFYASRGGYDSRAAANMLLSSGMELQGQEEERQYNRFNQRYLQKYNKLVDLTNLSMQKAGAGFNMAMSIGSANENQRLNRQNQLLNIAGMGAGAASNMAGLAAQTSGQLGTMSQNAANQMVNISQVNSSNQQNALLQQGANQANMWNTIGQAPANYLANRYILQNL